MISTYQNRNRCNPSDFKEPHGLSAHPRGVFSDFFKLMLVMILGLAVLCSGLQAGEEEDFGVDVVFGWGGCYRPMEWTPVEIGIRHAKLSEPFAGHVVLSTQQDEMNRMNVVSEFVLTPEGSVYLPLVTKLTFGSELSTIQIRNEENVTVWRQELELFNISDDQRLIKPLEETDLLVGLGGGGRFGLYRLGEHTCGITHEGMGKVYVKEKRLAMFPWDWTGYSSLDLLMMYNPDWDELNVHQVKAIMQWVSNGGKLLIILGSHPIADDHALAQWMPFVIGPARQIELGSSSLSALRLNNEADESVVGYPLSLKGSGDFSHVETFDGECGLMATGYVDFGRVGVLGFDPSGLSDRQQGSADAFWVHCLGEMLQDMQVAMPVPAVSDEGTDAEEADQKKKAVLHGGMGGFRGNMYGQEARYFEDRFLLSRGIDIKPEKKDDEESYSYRHYEVDWSHQAINNVMEYLYDISELRPLSIWWVILVLVMLSLLLGPIDYLVLKRMDRLPLTWVTATGWILVFTVGAYYGVQALRGGNLQVRAVTIQDGIAGSPAVWDNTYCGLFAPSSDNYLFDVNANDQWWSGVSPVQDIMFYHSGTASRNIYCYQHDGGNLPYSLPVNIWSMQCLVNEAPVSSLPFEAEVERSGSAIEVRIRNLGDRELKGGYVLVDGQVPFRFGAVSARSSKRFEGELKSSKRYAMNTLFGPNKGNKQHPLAIRQFGNDWESVCIAPGAMARTRIIRAYLAHGAALVCVEVDQPELSFSVKDKACQYSHVCLAREVVFPVTHKKEAEQ